MFFFFFFQAEDGIRDLYVTGVQTCALPIFTCWRKLAENLNVCLRKGDPVLVRGKLEVRPYVARDGQSRTAVDVDAITVGHDLTRGVAHFLRVSAMAGKTAAELAEGENGDGYGGAASAGDDGAAAL